MLLFDWFVSMFQSNRIWWRIKQQQDFHFLTLRFSSVLFVSPFPVIIGGSTLTLKKRQCWMILFLKNCEKKLIFFRHIFFVPFVGFIELFFFHTLHFSVAVLWMTIWFLTWILCPEFSFVKKWMNYHQSISFDPEIFLHFQRIIIMTISCILMMMMMMPNSFFTHTKRRENFFSTLKYTLIVYVMKNHE